MSSPALVGARNLQPPFLLLDARAGAEAFLSDHLEGALPADLDRCLSDGHAPGADPARGGRHPLPSPEAWARQLGAWGIRPGTRVVACDDAGGAAGAARLWWMLRAFGHEAVAVLEGTFAQARAEGMPDPGAPPPPAPPYPEDRWLWPRVELPLVQDLARDPDWKVLDVRSAPRYRGETEPFDPVAGHIPGALNLPYSENLTPDGRFKSPQDLRKLYLDLLGATPRGHLVVHCGSGVTACHTLLALDLAGLSGAALYVGSWSEWCRSGLPIARGPAAGA